MGRKGFVETFPTIVVILNNHIPTPYHHQFTLDES